MPALTMAYLLCRSIGGCIMDFQKRTKYALPFPPQQGEAFILY